MRIHLDTSRHPYSVRLGDQSRCFSNREAAIQYAIQCLDRRGSLILEMPDQVLHRREVAALELRQISSGVE